MKKILGLFVIVILMLGVSVVAEEISVDKKADDFVRDVAKMKGIDKNNVEGIKELDLNTLPEKVNLENVDDTNLALYEVEVTDSDKPVYIVTASSKFFKKSVRIFSQKVLLNFGYSGELAFDSFLETSSGVKTSMEKGYVATRDGSITALSTNLEVLSTLTKNPIEIVIYKNSEEVGFRNSIISDSLGVYTDYDIISSDILKVRKGDVISVEVKVPEGVEIKDVITLLEMEYRE